MDIIPTGIFRPSKIRTYYGDFRTLTHLEAYWEDRVLEALKKGIEIGREQFKNLHKLPKDGGTK